MASWINITTDDLRDAKASALIDAFQSAALGAGQTDPVPRKIDSVCDRIRAEIQASAKYQVSATAHSIPPSLLDLAMRLIAWEMQSRINIPGGGFEPTKQDEIDHTNDLRYLERIARGEIPIDTPDNPLTTPDVQSGGSIAATTATRSSSRVTTRDRMGGL